MRLLIVTQVVDRNHDLLGAFHQWIVRFAEVFDSVEVICLQEGEHALPENVRVHSLGKESKPSRFRYLWNFYRYIFVLRKDYDVVFVHMNPEYVLLGGVYWKAMRKKVFLWYAHKKGSYLRRLSLLFLDRLVSVSKESNVDHASKKFLAVGHGIDTSSLSCDGIAPSDDKNIILSIGRLSAVKEYDRLLDAAHFLKSQYGRDDFIIRLVGSPARAEDYAYVEGLKRKAENLGLDVRFEGAVANKDIAPLLCRASVFVSMQCQGGAGKSFLEAMAVGTPTVVCTPVFNQELGTWKEYAFYDGTARDLAKKIDACLSLNSEKRAEFGKVLIRIVNEGYELRTLVLKIHDEFNRMK